MGGDWRIRIETIGVISNFQNYSRYYRSLFIFDCMVSGSDADFDSHRPTSTRHSTSKSSSSNSKSKSSGKSNSNKAVNGNKRSGSSQQASNVKKPESPTKTGLNKAAPAFFPSNYKQTITDTNRKRGSVPNSPEPSDNEEEDKNDKNDDNDDYYTDSEDDDYEFEEDIDKYEAKLREQEEMEYAKKYENKPKEYKIIDKLMRHKLGSKFGLKSGDIPKYIIDTFNTFCKEKKVITLNIFYLEKYFKDFSDLIMNTVERDNKETGWVENPYSSKNTMYGSLFDIFDNITTLEIQSTKHDGFPSYSFNLMSLLSAVELKASFKEIIIKATWEEGQKSDGKRSWIYTMWHTSPLGAVKKLLKDSQCDITFRKSKNSVGNYEDLLVIYRV